MPQENTRVSFELPEEKEKASSSSNSVENGFKPFSETLFNDFKYSVVDEGHGKFSYDCNVCNYKTKQIRNIKRHTRNVHSLEGRVICSHCERSFKNKNSLRSHTATAHKPKKGTDDVPNVTQEKSFGLSTEPMEVTPMASIKEEIVESDEEKNLIESFLVGTNENKLKTLSERMEGKPCDRPLVSKETITGSRPIKKDNAYVGDERVQQSKEGLSVLKNSHLYF